MHLFLGYCGLILQLAPYFGPTLGPTAPKVRAEREVGIDRPN